MRSRGSCTVNFYVPCEKELLLFFSTNYKDSTQCLLAYILHTNTDPDSCPNLRQLSLIFMCTHAKVLIYVECYNFNNLIKDMTLACVLLLGVDKMRNINSGKTIQLTENENFFELSRHGMCNCHPVRLVYHCYVLQRSFEHWTDPQKLPYSPSYNPQPT